MSIEPASLAHRADFRLGSARIRPALRTVEGPADSIQIEPLVMHVLVALADAKGDVLTRDDLIRLCWNGRIVGDDSISRAISAVRRAALATAAGFSVETVPRIGYRMLGIEQADCATPCAVPEAKRLGLDRRTMVAGSAIALTLGVGGAAAWLYQRKEDEIDELIARAQRLDRSGKPDGAAQAEVLLRKAIARDSGRADAWGWLATVIDDSEKAREAAQHALTLDPKEPNARAVLAYQRRDLDAWTQWEDALLGVLADAAENVLALNSLTFFYQGMGRCRDSRDMNERAIRADPFNPTPQHRRAIKHWIFGRVAAADQVVDQGLRLWPRNPAMWNARMMIYAFTDRAPAALALLDDVQSRPVKLTPPSIESWRAAVTAIATRAPRDIARALEVCTHAAALAPGLAAHAIMTFSHLERVDAAYRVAGGLFEGRGPVVQRMRGVGLSDVYSASAWGRTQFLFIPATTALRADKRFPDLCRRLGHVEYWRRRGIWPDRFVRGALQPS
ncbi:winged helix-turn-helix domain-containing protein [Sphingomonas sp. MG17]|uniref:Winged helix-turn-helix domain-containing protein n=1 Tax=Sphingomonas tagetis TaxID=2949092 RepID=A0A9X2KM51_9SPHN|nr:winged helix-turn-helix domain-containing protein [Sphingomonas tagetis]MCP3731515.1 winged helix-turn-helix domain-containing protein [Sphingomonas tagetis]